MLFRINRLRIFFFLLSFALINSVLAGTDFVSIAIPATLHHEFSSMQQYVANRLKPNFVLDRTSPQNLHITLKEIGDLSHAQRKEVKKALKNVTTNSKCHDIGHVLQDGRLKLKPDGLVMLKIRSQWLTFLAHKIDASLKKLKKQNKIKTFFTRMDFPDHAHITLGHLKYKNKPVDKSKTPRDMIGKIQKKFKNHFHQNFVVDRFVLLKSNSSQMPRVYSNKGTFYL